MKPSTIQRIINETIEFTTEYIVKTTSGAEHRFPNDAANMCDVTDDVLTYHGDNGTVWISCDKIESISI